MSEKPNKHYPWYSGMPTSPDVELIRENYPDLQVGTRIPYEDISALIGVGVETMRFRSVTNAWRKRELTDGRVINCEAKTGFIVASYDQITGSTIDIFRSIGRKARKQWKHLSTIRPASELEKAVKEHQMRLCAIQDKDARKARMNVLPLTASPEPVRIAPPSAA